MAKKKIKTSSLVKGVNNYIDSLENPQEMKFVLKVYIEYRSGKGVFEMQVCYATSDFILPFIEEMEKNTKVFKLDSLQNLQFPSPKDNDVLIDNSLINREYEINYQGDKKTFSISSMTSYFRKTKLLRKVGSIFFHSESYNMTVQIGDKQKPMYKGVMFFDQGQSSSYIEDFKKFLKFHENTLDIIANSVE